MIEMGPGGLRDWLWRDALPLWSSVGVDPAGGFHEGIDRRGRPWLADRRLRVQARQTWVFASAQQRRPSGAWRAAMAHGVDELLGRRQREDGLFHGVVDQRGVPVATSPLLYDQAFVLLAFAAVHRARPGLIDAPKRAGALMGKIGERYRHRPGGFIEAAPETPYYANPHMHLFEALLAWEAIEPSGTWAAEADAIAELALARFIDPASGAVREHFDADWTPAPGQAGRIVEPGHQFEWSWLLRRWGAARGRSDAIAAADRLLRIGAERGVDPARGVAINAMLDDGAALDRGARLWPQTEWLKAAATAARATGDPEDRARYEAETIRAANALRRYLSADVAGVWRDTLSAAGTFEDAFAPASSLYHIAGAVFEI